MFESNLRLCEQRQFFVENQHRLNYHQTHQHLDSNPVLPTARREKGHVGIAPPEAVPERSRGALFYSVLFESHWDMHRKYLSSITSQLFLSIPH
jgi:hypothetical protein